MLQGDGSSPLQVLGGRLLQEKKCIYLNFCLKKEKRLRDFFCTILFQVVLLTLIIFNFQRNKQDCFYLPSISSIKSAGESLCGNLVVKELVKKSLGKLIWTDFFFLRFIVHCVDSFILCEA